MRLLHVGQNLLHIGMGSGDDVDGNHFSHLLGRGSAGHLEFQYTARASYALNKAFGAPIGKSFGITVGAPAAIGLVLADTAVKAATVDAISVATPGNGGTSYSNEVNFFFSGDSGAVKQAIIAARDVGMQLLKALEPGEELKSATTPYII